MLNCARPKPTTEPLCAAITQTRKKKQTIQKGKKKVVDDPSLWVPIKLNYKLVMDARPEIVGPATYHRMARRQWREAPPKFPPKYKGFINYVSCRNWAVRNPAEARLDSSRLVNEQVDSRLVKRDLFQPIDSLGSILGHVCSWRSKHWNSFDKNKFEHVSY